MFRFPREGDEDSPWPILERLRELPELGDLTAMLKQEIQIAFTFRAGEWVQSNRTILGKCYLPQWSGRDLQGLWARLLEDTIGYLPDFLIALSDDWWADASGAQREALLFHELLHAGHAKDRYGVPRYDPEGRPVCTLVPHDLEEFNAVVERYGAWSEDIRAFLRAASGDSSVTLLRVA